jgi:hypothetical protein
MLQPPAIIADCNEPAIRAVLKACFYPNGIWADPRWMKTFLDK